MKRRMSVSRCCCTSDENFCPDNGNDVNYSNDFSTGLGTGWNDGAGWTVTGGRLQRPSTATDNQIDRLFKFDPDANSTITFSSEIFWSATGLTTGVVMFSLGSPSRLFLIARPTDGNYGYSDSTTSFGIISTTPTSGDEVELALTLTSYTEGTGNSATFNFDYDMNINSSTVRSGTHSITLSDKFEICAMYYGLNYSPVTGQRVAEYDNFDLTIT